MRAIPLAVLVLAACGAGELRDAVSTSEAGQDEPRKEWIASDVAIATRVHAAFALGATDAAELRAALGIPDHREGRDQGFGARVLRDELHGGYTTHWVTLVTFRGAGDEVQRVASVRIDARSSVRESWKHVEGGLREAWGDDAKQLVELTGGARIEWTDDEVLRDMRAAREAVLGVPASRYDPPAELADGMQLLLDPREEHDVGDLCYYAGVPPVGSEAALGLAGGGHVDLLGIVLRGANPEGRVYAARELAKLRAAGTELAGPDLAALRAVRALDVPISTCSGCFVTDQRAGDVLPAVD